MDVGTPSNGSNERLVSRILSGLTPSLSFYWLVISMSLCSQRNTDMEKKQAPPRSGSKELTGKESGVAERVQTQTHYLALYLAGNLTRNLTLRVNSLPDSSSVLPRSCCWVVCRSGGNIAAETIQLGFVRVNLISSRESKNSYWYCGQLLSSYITHS